VHQEQVDVLEPELLEGFVEGSPHVIGTMVGVAELGGDEDLVAREPGGGDRLAHAPLRPVLLSAVDVAVPDLECKTDNAGGRLGVGRGVLAIRLDAQGAEAKLWDGLILECPRGRAADASAAPPGPGSFRRHRRWS
jgi:hypothetical protein